MSFFQRLSACLHDRLRERVESVSHGSEGALVRCFLSGATESKMLVQVELKRPVNSSASYMVGLSPSKEEEKEKSH